MLQSLTRRLVVRRKDQKSIITYPLYPYKWKLFFYLMKSPDILHVILHSFIHNTINTTQLRQVYWDRSSLRDASVC